MIDLLKVNIGLLLKEKKDESLLFGIFIYCMNI